MVWLKPTMTSVARCARCAGKRLLLRLGSASSLAREKTCSTLASCAKWHAVCLKTMKCNGKDSRSAQIILNSFSNLSSAMYCNHYLRPMSSHRLSSSSTVSKISSSASAGESGGDGLRAAPRKRGLSATTLSSSLLYSNTCTVVWSQINQVLE